MVYTNSKDEVKERATTLIFALMDQLRHAEPAVLQAVWNQYDVRDEPHTKNEDHHKYNKRWVCLFSFTNSQLSKRSRPNVRDFKRKGTLESSRTLSKCNLAQIILTTIVKSRLKIVVVEVIDQSDYSL